MRLYLIRHGDPDYAHDSLTEHGHLEAEALAKRMAGEKIDQILCSSMGRAIETMKPTAMKCGLDYTICDWMREVDWGDTVQICQHPWDLSGEYLIGDPPLSDWQKNPWFDAPRVANNLKTRTDALDAFLLTQGYRREGNHYIQMKENDRHIALFCHAGFANGMFSHLMNIPLTTIWSDFWLAPSSVTIILFARRDTSVVYPRCIAYGDTAHLYAAGLPVRPRGLKGDFH